MLLYLQGDANGSYNTWRDDCTQWIARPPEAQRRLPQMLGESVSFKRGQGVHVVDRWSSGELPDELSYPHKRGQ